MSEPYLDVAPPLPPAVWLRRATATLPFPLGGATAIHAEARAGLYQGLSALGSAPGAVALLPAYHHGSEIEAYVRAGYTPRFYDTGPGLAPDVEDLSRHMTADVRIVHLIHYLGLAQPVDAWRRFADQHGILLVEDVAQGWLGACDGTPLGATGDLALFSVYKSVGVPDGGVAILRGERVVPAGRPRSDLAAIGRRHATFLSARIGRLGAARAGRVSARSYDPARDIDLGDPDRPAGRMTIPLLRRLATPMVAERRRDHYRRMLADLASWVPEPFRVDPGEASPFAFPIVARDKPTVIRALRARGIGAVDAWSVPHGSLAVAEHPGAARWRAGIVLLPVHQELRDVDLSRVVAEARRVLVRAT